jgi:hypothetical protein
MSDQDKKDLRRQKLEKAYKKDRISEEQRHLSKSKKEHKKKMQEMQAEEKWEDWENEIY